jgi:hypothetical protein
MADNQRSNKSDEVQHGDTSRILSLTNAIADDPQSAHESAARPYGGRAVVGPITGAFDTASGRKVAIAFCWFPKTCPLYPDSGC